MSDEVNDALSEMSERFGTEPISLSGEPPPGLPKLTQKSRWSCIPTAFAMVLSKDSPSKAGHLLEEIMEQLGRDDERGFHVQELLGIAVSLRWAFSPFDAEPDLERATCCVGGCDACCGTGLMPEAPLVVWPLRDVLKAHDGVLVGKRKGAQHYHAVAWCCATQQVLDPEHGVYGLENFDVMTFWAGFRLK